jgi:FMN-dependent NADH-azoreductase
MRLLRIDSSLRVDGSVTRELADVVERTWLAAAPDADVVRRDVTAASSLHEVWRLAAGAGLIPDHQHTPAMRTASALAAQVADEALDADAIAIAAPLYNFGAPAGLKSWFDLLITDRRFSPRHTPIGRALAGVPVALLLAHGGGYRPGTPRAGWDHGTPYLLRLLADVFGADVATVTAELTAADADPAMAAMRPLARRSRADALALAGTTGAWLADRRRPAAAGDPVRRARTSISARSGQE